VAVGVTGNGATATFNPAVIRVEMGVNNTVAWSNSDTVIHTVTSTNQTASGALLFNSGDMGRGAEFSYTFTSPGTYTYICVYHAEMVGKVIVVA
jgi:plastocyanin